MDNSLIKEIEDKLSIDHNRKSPCPIHNGEDNNFIFNEGGYGHCFSQCNETFNIHQIGKALGIDTSSASGLDIETLLKAKGFPKQQREIITHDFQLIEGKSNGKPLVKIPYYSKAGDKPQFRIRKGIIPSDGETFSWDKGSSPSLYNSHRWIKNSAYGIIVEGETDTWTLYSAGWRNTLGVAGTSNLKINQNKHLFDEIKQLYVWHEKDSASTKMLETLKEYNPDIKVLAHPEYKDVNEILQREGFEYLKSWCEKNINNEAPTLNEYLSNLVSEERKEILSDENVQIIINRNQGDIFKTFKEDISNLTPINHDTALLIFIICATRGFKKPINLYLFAPSSTGKTYLTETVLDNFICDEDKEVYKGGATAGSLIYKEDTLQDKVLYFAEKDSVANGDNSLASAFRSLITGGRLKYETSDATQSKGRHHRDIDRGGNVATLTTGIENLDDQLNTRMLTLEIPHSPEIVSMITRWTLVNKYEKKNIDVEAWKKISRLLSLNDKKALRENDNSILNKSIPFMPAFIELLPPVFNDFQKTNRDISHLESTIKAIALIRNSLKENMSIDIEPTLEDYDVARTVLDQAFVTSATDGISPAQEPIMKAIYELRKPNFENTGFLSVTQKDIDKNVKTSSSTNNKHLKNLEKIGKIYQDRISRGWHLKNEYIADGEYHLPTSKQIKELMIDSSDSSDSSISKTLMTTDSFIETDDDGKEWETELLPW